MMRFMMPRWLLFLEAALFVGALLVLAYKAAMFVQPLPPSAVERTPHFKKRDPQAVILDYYHQYPERYLLIVDETWRYIAVSHAAYHSVTLRNSATVAYNEIEIRFSYESSNGTVLKSQTVKIPGSVAPLGTMEVKSIEIKDVPPAAANVVTAVAKAAVAR